MERRRPVRTRHLLSVNTLARDFFLPANDLIAGTDIYRYLVLLEKSQWWSEEDLKRYQDKRLRNLIDHAYHNVPYYRELFRSLNISPSDITCVKDLVKIPLLTKDEVRKHPQDFLAGNVAKGSLVHKSTSGSSGKVFEFYIDRTTLSISRAAGLRAWGFAGYDIGDKIVTLAGSSLLPKNIPILGRIRYSFSRNLPLSSYSLDQDRLQVYMREIGRYQPKYLRGYPSSIVMLAEYALEHSIDNIRLEGIMTTAESLQKNQREIISDAFCCDVFDQFGCFDGGANACECDQHEGYHISVERAVHEFLDEQGQPINPGENGHIILTDLWNYAMPLIRYDAGDMGVPDDHSCSCGRTLPLIEKIMGRTIEQIVLPDGRSFPGLILTDIFDEGELVKSILDYQIIQERINEFHVCIVPSPDSNNEQISKIVTDFFRMHLDSGVRISFHYTDRIPRTEANKRTIVMSRVKR